MNRKENITFDDFLKQKDFSDEQKRFMIELDFVQSLANVYYLKWLSDKGYLEDEAFLRYIKYLQYWKKPEYAKYLIYPECLFFLESLQDEAFRYLLSDINHINYLNYQCYTAIRNHSEIQKPKRDGSSDEVKMEVEQKEDNPQQ